MLLSKVVLPHPEGPSRAAISPEFKLNERLSRTFLAPNETSRFLISSDVILVTNFLSAKWFISLIGPA
jgi:hypothetical protein